MKGRLFRSTLLAVVVMLVLASSAAAAATLAITTVTSDGLGGVTIAFTASELPITSTNLRLAIWEPQDNKSFQTLADWGATLQFPPGAASGTVTVPEVIANHAGDQPCPALKFQLKVGKLTSNIVKLTSYCPSK